MRIRRRREHDGRGQVRRVRAVRRRIGPQWWFLAGAAWIVLLWPPGRFEPNEMPSSVRVTDRRGEVLYEYRPEGRARPVGLEHVPTALLGALVATEDRRFLWHPGVDAWAIVRAVVSNIRSGTVVSGASTLAMQVARMRRGASSTPVSKLIDAWTALRLTAWYGRPAILDEWLSRAYFGRGANGVDAAARAWFARSPASLNLAEIAFLVGVPQSPSIRSRDPWATGARDRQRVVLGAMVDSGLITDAEAQAAAVLPLDFADPEPVPLHAAHLSIAEARRAAGSSAVEVRTTLDFALQAALEDLARGHVGSLADRGVGQVAAIVLDNRSGEVRGWLGSADYEDADALGSNDGVLMRRQPGSALKPFAYAEAISSRLVAPSSILADIETPIVDAGAAFSAENYDRRYHGPVSARRALASSYNIPAIRLARRLGPQRVLDRLRAFGFESLDQPASFYGVGIVLGNGEVRLLELARAYAALARGGSLPPVRTTAWIRTAAGDTLAKPVGPAVSTGIDAATAFLVSDMLADPAARSPAFGRGGPLELPFPAATKTGTSKDYRDNWAVGYTPDVTVAVWAGNFDGTPMREVSGVSGAGTLMRAVLEWIGPGGPFVVPPGVTRASVCPQSGQKPGRWCRGTSEEWFLAGSAPLDTCVVHRRIAVDAATGFLADASTRPENVRWQDFTVYPDEFRGWMLANGLPQPPPVRPAVTTGGVPTIHPDFRILIPEDGTILQIDPVLRPDYQRLHLKAATPGNLYDLHWVVDDVRLDAPFDSAAWSLVPGRHRIEARGIAPDGSGLRSRAVFITVYPADS